MTLYMGEGGGGELRMSITVPYIFKLEDTNRSSFASHTKGQIHLYNPPGLQNNLSNLFNF